MSIFMKMPMVGRGERVDSALRTWVKVEGLSRRMLMVLGGRSLARAKRRGSSDGAGGTP